jgi:hypothetical protein
MSGYTIVYGALTGRPIIVGGPPDDPDPAEMNAAAKRVLAAMPEGMRLVMRVETQRAKQLEEHQKMMGRR